MNVWHVLQLYVYEVHTLQYTNGHSGLGVIWYFINSDLLVVEGLDSPASIILFLTISCLMQPYTELYGQVMMSQHRAMNAERGMIG